MARPAFTLDLVGQHWLYVNRVGEAYLQWRINGLPHDEWGPIDDTKIDQLLAEPRLGERGEPHTMAASDRRLLIAVLHRVIAEHVDEGGRTAN